MEMKKPAIIQKLLLIINSAESKSTDVAIAEALIEHRYDLDQYSMEELADKYYVSQPSFSRFIRKMGYTSYSRFKDDMALCSSLTKEEHGAHFDNTEEVMREVYEGIRHATMEAYQVEPEKIEEVVRLMREFDNIVFMGSELSMSIIRLLQLKLIAMDKNVYTPKREDMQRDILKESAQDTLFIFISIEERWYTELKSISSGLQKRGTWLLMTPRKDHADQELFDHIMVFGNEPAHNYGYNGLMYIAPVLWQLL